MIRYASKTGVHCSAAPAGFGLRSLGNGIMSQGSRDTSEGSENNQTGEGTNRRSERLELRVEITKQREQGEEWEGGGHRVYIGVE
jgi:hypothetical protein